MLDPIDKLKQEYFTALDGAVTINAAAVPVYDTMAPDGSTAPYIVLGDVTGSGEESTKTHDIHNVTMIIDLVTMFTGKGIDTTDVNSMANQVLGIVGDRADSYFDLSPSFKMVTSELVGNNSLTEITDSKKYPRRIIRMRHLIQEITKAL